jgi:hypothetical protein
MRVVPPRSLSASFDGRAFAAGSASAQMSVIPRDVKFNAVAAINVRLPTRALGDELTPTPPVIEDIFRGAFFQDG